MLGVAYKKVEEHSCIDCWLKKLISHLSYPIDEYVEEQILNGETFLIEKDGTEIGFFVLHNRDTLIKFHIEEAHSDQSETIFKDICKKFSLCFAQFASYENHARAIATTAAKKIETIGLLFREDKSFTSVPKTNYSWQKATHQEEAKILQISGNFFEASELTQRIDRKEVFLLSNKEVILGIGLAMKSYYQPNIINLGVFTNSNYRKQGIGVEIMIRLKQEAQRMQLTPYCGCEESNHASKATLEKAGFIMVEKLLLFHLE